MRRKAAQLIAAAFAAAAACIIGADVRSDYAIDEPLRDMVAGAAVFAAAAAIQWAAAELGKDTADDH